MASRSSRRRSGSSGSRDDFARLLRDGAIIRDPSTELQQVAGQLEELGLVQSTTREFVRCADPQDRDFPPRNRHCRGRIYVEDDLDEQGHEFRCSECERAVFPFSYNKRRHTELRTKVVPDGVAAFVRVELDKLKAEVRDIAEGVVRVELGMTGVYLCLLDYCSDERFHARDWAKTNRTCYVTVDPTHADERFLPDEWLTKVSLADVLAGTIRLDLVVEDLANAGAPSAVADASVPVYSKTVPVVVADQDATGPRRRFVVEVGPKTVRIEGVEVVAPQAGVRFEAFRILWDRFLDDLRECQSPDDFTVIKLADIVRRLEERMGTRIDDETSIRRAVNRLQADIEKAFKKKVGDPMDREDIVETHRWKGASGGEYGYRINPRTVCARPFQAPPA